MKVSSTLNIGGASFTFDVEEQDEMQAMVNAITLASPRRTCNICGDEGLESKHLLAYKTKEGYRYVKVQCACGARSTLGQFRDGDGFFWKEYEAYEASDSSAGDGSGATGGAVQRPKELDQKAQDMIGELLDALQWAAPKLRNHLALHYNVSTVASLSTEQAREFYAHLQAELREEAPF